MSLKENKQLETTTERIVPIITNNFRKCQTIKVNTAPRTDEATEAL